ncbi:MAG: hypothetical protein R2873_13630 [Caldilineaceae bacterium]|nr:hypothetical protein [Caldilineaceae bacterium]
MTRAQSHERSPPSRKVYVLRCWWSPEDRRWRSQLQNVHSGEMVTFADGEALVEHLRLQLPDQPGPGLR